MIYLRHKTLLIISGLIWFSVGISLLSMGLNFLFNNLHHSSPLLSLLIPLVGKYESAAFFLTVAGLAIGYGKGKFVLGKSAKKGIERIQGFPNPMPLSQIYTAKYYVLLGLMIGLGMSIKYFGVPTDIRGFVDVAIGSALINGSMFYFRACTCTSAQDAV